eukprot:COSAG01_NODE_11424_length_1938_cov_1.313214_1_plen_206_part_00
MREGGSWGGRGSTEAAPAHRRTRRPPAACAVGTPPWARLASPARSRRKVDLLGRRLSALRLPWSCDALASNRSFSATDGAPSEPSRCPRRCLHIGRAFSVDRPPRTQHGARLTADARKLVLPHVPPRSGGCGGTVLPSSAARSVPSITSSDPPPPCLSTEGPGPPGAGADDDAGTARLRPAPARTDDIRLAIVSETTRTDAHGRR